MQPERLKRCFMKLKTRYVLVTVADPSHCLKIGLAASNFTIPEDEK